MCLAPVRSMIQQKRCQIDVAAKHGVIERGCIPVSSARVEGPTELDHDFCRSARTPRHGIREQSKLVRR